MAFKETLDMTKHALTTNLACIYIFFQTFYLSEKMKDKHVAIIQKAIIMKIII